MLSHLTGIPWQAVVTIVAVSGLPRFGHAVLSFLRDLDAYRAERRSLLRSIKH
jgi:hypothetical protein